MCRTSCSTLTTCSQCTSFRHCRFCGVTCIDYANPCPAQPDLVAGDVCSAQFDITVGTQSPTIQTTTTALFDACEGKTLEECAQSVSQGCVWLTDEPTETATSTTITSPASATDGTCVCTDGGGCSDSPTTITNSHGGSTTNANNNQGITITTTTAVAIDNLETSSDRTKESADSWILCVALGSVSVTKYPCDNTIIATLSSNERVSVTTDASVNCNGTTVVRVIASGVAGYAPTNAFTTQCTPDIVDESPQQADTAVYILAAVVAVLVIVGLVALSVWIVRRRHPTDVTVAMPAPASPYDRIPPARSSNYANQISVVAKSPYAVLSATEIQH